MDGHAYKQRKPRESAHFQLVEDHFETLERIWEERYLERYGFWRSHYMRVIWEYLDCGDLKNGCAPGSCAIASCSERCALSSGNYSQGSLKPRQTVMKQQMPTRQQ